MTRVFVTLPTFDTEADALAWCDANDVFGMALHRGSDGRVRGRGEQEMVRVTETLVDGEDVHILNYTPSPGFWEKE